MDQFSYLRQSALVLPWDFCLAFLSNSSDHASTPYLLALFCICFSYWKSVMLVRIFIVHLGKMTGWLIEWFVERFGK